MTMDENDIYPVTHSTEDVVERVKARLQQEGREARNLIAYSLLLQEHKPRNIKLGSFQKREKKLSLDSPQQKQDKRQRSASAGRDPQACLRARHWGFLFRNLQLAVDEIYQTCEDDESTVECKEAILMLERYTNDFYKLIEWLKLKWEYENTAAPERPMSVTWEIRTSSPGKIPPIEKRNYLLMDAKRSLNFNALPGSKFSKADSSIKIPSNKHGLINSKSMNPIISIQEVKSDRDSSTESIKNSKSTEDQIDSHVLNKSKGGIEDNGIESIVEPGFAPLEKMKNGEEKDCQTADNFVDSSGHSKESNMKVIIDDKLSEVVSLPFDRGENVRTDESSGCSGVVEVHEVKEIEDIQKMNGKTSSLVVTTKDVEVHPNVSPTGTLKSKQPSSARRSPRSTPISALSDEIKASEQDISKKVTEIVQNRNVTKAAPTVNMNKASQVRKAFNQSKTPNRTVKSPQWKPVGLTQSEPKQVKQVQNGASRGSQKRSTTVDLKDCKSYSARVAKNIPDKSGTSNKGLLKRSATTLSDAHKQRKQGLETEGLSNKTPSTSSLSSITTTSSGQSWADKVKGTRSEVSSVSLQDDEGWEVVRRGRRSNTGSAASLNSHAGKAKLKDVANSQRTSFEGSLSRKERNFNIKDRFNQPSSAASMPSLFIDKQNTESDKANLHKKIQRHNTVDISDTNSSVATKEKSSESRSTKKGSTIQSSTISTKAKAKSREDKQKNRLKSKSSFNLDTKAFSSDSEVKVSKGKICEGVAKSKSDANLRKDSFCEDIKEVSGDRESGVNEESEGVCNVTGVNLKSNKKIATSKKCLNKDSESNYNGSNEMNFKVNKGKLCEDKPAVKKVDGRAEEKLKLEDVHLRTCDDSIEEKKILNGHESKNLSPAADTTGNEKYDEDQKLFKEMNDVYPLDDANPPENSDACSSVDEENDKISQTYYHYDPAIGSITAMNWAEMDALDNIDSRLPGRLLEIHEKLSSPSRKLPISEKYKRHKDRLEKAQESRKKFITQKTEKLKELFKKIDEVHNDKERIINEKRSQFEAKMNRAEELRKDFLKEIVNKAHDEETKAKEIAFINSLESQNKLHDLMQQNLINESRLAEMAEERNRKQEEKAAKEAKAQERRRTIEAERQARMQALCEKRRETFERIDRQQAERREELLEQAREKQKDRDERITALAQAQQAKESELERKIRQKLEETARRHEENIKLIKEKALELSIMRYSTGCDDAPKLKRYETKKLCTLCNALISSEVYLLSHLRGKQHQESLMKLHKSDIVSNEERATYNLKHILDAPSNIDDPQITKDIERQKSLKKRCRKIRTRMASRGRTFLESFIPPCNQNTSNKASSSRGKMNKALNQVGKLIRSQGTGPWPVSDVGLLDKSLLELHRILNNNSPTSADNDENIDPKGRVEQEMFLALDGFMKLSALLELITLPKEDQSCVVPAKSLAYCCRVMVLACKGCLDNCSYILNSNILGNVIEQLLRRLTDLTGELSRIGSCNSINTIAALPSDPATASLMELISEVLNNLSIFNTVELGNNKKDDIENYFQKIQDVVSYCVSIGVADKITYYLSHVQNPVENNSICAEVILGAIGLVTSLTRSLIGRSNPGDPTQLTGTLHITDACGVLSLSYGILLHSGGRSGSSTPPQPLSASTLAITLASTTLLTTMAKLDLGMFQLILGGEGISLEFRHIASFLLWYSSHVQQDEILHNIITLVGYFTLNNKENQVVVQSGEIPSVLQQLCYLPWQFFSEPHLTALLFPTLIACCYQNEDNINILKQEMSYEVLEDYLKSEVSKDIPLIKLLKR